MIKFLASLLFGFLRPGQLTPSNAASAGPGIMAWGGLAAGFVWLIGPGRDWQITLNALELGFFMLLAAVGGFVLLKLPPPGGQ